MVSKTEKFMLVGRQSESEYVFDGKNVSIVGEVARKKMVTYYQQMKVLYFPSENDPCSNTVIESILCGVPVCYHNSGGHPELVKDCGLPLERFDELLSNIDKYRGNCLLRNDLNFNEVMEKYIRLLESH